MSSVHIGGIAHYRGGKSRWFLQLRLTFSTAAAVFFLAESMNADFLRPADPSQIVFVHACIAIFGVAWLVQTFVLTKQLYREDLNDSPLR